MSDRVDEWMMAYFTEFEGKKLRSIARAAAPRAGDKPATPSAVFVIDCVYKERL